jgi:hypothetical protein
MPQIYDPIREALELEEERRQAEEIAFQQEKRRDHEFRLAKLKYSTQPRYKSVERVIITLTKALALPIAIICVTVLVAKGKELPDSLTKFITL